ncbi:MAG TPA: lysophospholipid acyltransferase family protein [Acidobacteriaceae bacterium]
MDDTTPYTLNWRKRWMLWMVPPLVALLLRLLHATLRYEEIFDDDGRADQPGEASVWCFWHRCLLPAACFFRGRPRTTLLISASFDGELIARTIERLGYETVRGSSSRAGSAGLLALARAVQDGATAVIPGDGPRGPRYLLKPGIARLARLAGQPINSFYLLPQRAWVLRSWDALLIPKPFSRVVMAWGRPVPPPESAEAEEQVRLAVEATLQRLRLLAEVHFAARTAVPH